MKKDEKFVPKEEYKKKKAWGLLTSIDLFNCEPKTLRSRKKIEMYIIKLCNLIEMKRFGEPIIVRFGANPDVYGFSAVQLIETSCISGHFSEENNSIYIDIFSCKWYDQEKAVEFTKEFFGAENVKFNIVLRGEGAVTSCGDFALRVL